MTEKINFCAAKADLSRPVDRVAQGEEIVIAKAGKPPAQLAPFRSVEGPREPANLLGITFIAEDFDDPLPPEIQSAFVPDR